MSESTRLDNVAELAVRQARKAAGAPPPDPEAWPDPILPGSVRTPEIPADILPTWAGDMAAAVAESTQTPPALPLLCAIAVLATCAQRRFEVAPHGDPDYREPLCLWTMAVSPSGSRKSSVIAAHTDALVHWEKLQRDRARSEIAAVNAARDVTAKRIETLKATAGREEDPKVRAKLQEQIQREHESMPEQTHAPRLFTGDATPERLQQLLAEQAEAMAVISDEGGIFAQLAGGYSGAASFDVYLQGHAGSAMRVDRAGRMAHLDRPALSFGLALQPGILTDAGRTRRFRDSGLMARFLYGVPRSNVGERDVRARYIIPHDVRAAWERNVHALLADVARPARAPKVLPFDGGARECWLELAAEIERDQGDGGRLSHISDWSAKLPGAAARLAGLFALAELGTHIERVELGASERAVRLARLLVPHAEAAFRLMGAADAEGDALALLAWIRRYRMAHFTRREALRALEARFRTTERLLAAIVQLQTWGCLSAERKEREHSQGAPRIVYYVNPRLHSVDKSISA